MLITLVSALFLAVQTGGEPAFDADSSDRELAALAEAGNIDAQAELAIRLHHRWTELPGVQDTNHALLVDDAERAAAFVCLATAGIAVADAVNVVVVRGFSLVPLSVHASGIGVGVLAAILLLP